MKTFKVITLLVVLLVTTLSFTSCLDEKYNEIDKTTDYLGFDFKTTKEINVNVKALTNTGSPISGVYVELYSIKPFDENGLLIENSSDYLIFKGQTSENGSLTAKIAPATSVDSLFAVVNHIGLQSFQVVKINSDDLSIIFGGTSSQNSKANVAPSKVSSSGIWWISNFTKVNDFYTFGTFSSQGVPNYLEKTDDVITADFLADMNASLPEKIALPTSHPEYLTNQDDGNIVLVENAEVWVTFVHEGASYLNTLAYYTYPTNEIIDKTTKIKVSTIIFPNVSYSGSGGGLKSGNKVQILYFDEAKGQYTNVFPAGTTVSWMFRANGWNGSTVAKGYNTFYSNAAFNPEKDVNLKKHNVLLKDDVRKLLLIGFEDIARDNGSDNDFNDAVFYATVTPYTAVKSGIYQNITSVPQDVDKDGVVDSKDEYPNDPKRAFNNYYPAKNQTGTLAFEDLWPYKGDYDFNDLVVDYNFNQITNSDNKIVDIEAQITLRAIGAHYRNAFAIEFNTTPENVSSVSGQLITKKLFDIASNGTEKNQKKAVVYAFDDAFNVLSITGNSGYVNTTTSSLYTNPKVINMKISFINPVSTSELGGAPYNPFIVVNENRSKEVHLAGSQPTSLADLSLLGTGQDNSNITTGKCYMSEKYLPWALNIPTKFEYPIEKEDITKAYLMFNEWASSNGASCKDWYSNKTDYRDTKRIFMK